MPAIDVVSDANVVLKWFHEDGEEDVANARDVLEHHRDRRLVVHVLDLTLYEVGNALLRGRVRATAAQTSTVVAAIREICPVVAPDDDDLAAAAVLATEHDLTLYDATYAAIARRMDAALVTYDVALLSASLGVRPAELLRP
jgi:predicted nucleic acid-binding protein